MLLVIFPVLEKCIHIGSPQLTTISLVNIQNYNGAERKDLYLVLKVMAATASRLSYEQNLGAWHPPL